MYINNIFIVYLHIQTKGVVMADMTTIRVTKQLVNRLKQMITAQGTSDNLATLIEKLLTAEEHKYVHTHKGLVPIGGKLRIAGDANSPNHRVVGDEVATVIDIRNGEAYLDDNTILPKSIAYWSEPYND